MFNLYKFIQNIFLANNRIDDVNYKISQILVKNPVLTREVAFKLQELYYKKGDYELAYTMRNFNPELSKNTRSKIKSANNSSKKYID